MEIMSQDLATKQRGYERKHRENNPESDRARQIRHREKMRIVEFHAKRLYFYGYEPPVHVAEVKRRAAELKEEAGK